MVLTNKLQFNELQKTFWNNSVTSAATKPKTAHTVPSYLPAYNRWLSKCERARFGRLLTPQNMMQTRYDGSRVKYMEKTSGVMTNLFEKRLANFMSRFTPKNFGVYREFFNKTDSHNRLAANAFRQPVKNQPLNKTLLHMFAQRTGMAQNASYFRVFTNDNTLESSRKSPEMAVKLHLQGDSARNERTAVIPKYTTTFSVGARGIYPSTAKSLRSHLPAVFLMWNMAIRNSRVVSQKTGKAWSRIGGRRLDWVNFKLSNSLISIADFSNKMLQPTAAIESKLVGVTSASDLMKKAENLQPFFMHRDLNLATYEHMFGPASRTWRDFRGFRYMARSFKTSLERQSKARHMYLRNENSFMAGVRGGVSLPTAALALGNMRPGRLRPKCIYEYRVNKRWAGQRRYMMRMMDWKRVWQYRRYFRHWSAKNANGRRFEIARRYSNRLDNFVVSYLGARSIVYARELIKRGHVFVNGEQRFNVTMPVRQTEIVSLSKIAHMWLAQPGENRLAAKHSATRFSYYADVEDRRVIYGRHGHSAVLAHNWVHSGISRFGGRLQFAGSMIEGLTMWRR